MKKIIQLFLVTTAMFASSSSRVAAISPGITSFSWSGSQIIPDNNASGVAFTFNVAGGSPLVVTNLTIDLQIAGGWNGDLYAYLSHGSGFSVLLNRVGRTTSNPGGSGVSGMNIEFSDSYFTDIHTFAGSPLMGNFAPDGRNVNPFLVLDTDPRNAPLGNFTGLDPSGTWTLFFADLSPLSVSTVQSWTVSLGVMQVVPEPGCATFVGLVILLGFVRRAWPRR